MKEEVKGEEDIMNELRNRRTVKECGREEWMDVDKEVARDERVKRVTEEC